MADDDLRLTRKEIGRLVYNWIGVDGGYLGSFSYAKHDRFWLEVCGLSVGTAAYTGTTRECFEHTLFQAAPRDQAAALRAILEDYPPLDAPDPDQPKFRTEKLSREILGIVETKPFKSGFVTGSVRVGGRRCTPSGRGRSRRGSLSATASAASASAARRPTASAHAPGPVATATASAAWPKQPNRGKKLFGWQRRGSVPISVRRPVSVRIARRG